ncbi:MAG TPA: hypothetical protein VK786_05210 [bacterium]|jgi:hypothetical protein|nr:hypothetical protein [bacterium]
MRNIQALLLASGLCVLTAACATIGTPFDFSGPGDIVAGKTSKSDLIAEFGQPDRVGYDNGAEKWAYAYYHYSVFGNPKVKDLDVVFDKNGLVASYTYESSDLGEVEQQLPPATPTATP